MVARAIQSKAYLRPTYLAEKSSSQLFKHYAFGSTSCSVPTHLVNMGWEIMRKCGGLPLAVKSIASLLRHEPDEESWREILENDLWETNPSNDIFPALQISYARLPVHLKSCFLFCSMYPKGFELRKMKLIELWIAHGYIESRGKRRLTDIGVEYYEELKERSFLDDISDTLSEQCKLHDIIYDLARLNSEKEHCSIKTDQVHDIQEVEVPQVAYHLYVKGFVGCVNKVLQQNYLRGLRTLSLDLRGCRGDLEHQDCKTRSTLDSYLLWGDGIFCMGNTIISDLTIFEALKVMELKGSRLREIPDSIAQLKRLSYLCITSDSLEMLPLSIGLLYNLETLVLDCYASPLQCLPESIGNLANLQHMCIKCIHLKKLPRSLCSLTSLRRLLIRTKILEGLPSDLRLLCNLREFTMDSKQIQSLPDTIGCLGSLEELDFPCMNALQELPGALGNCRKLKTLQINECSLNYNPHNLRNFPAMRTMAACLSVTSIAWLKDMKSFEGDLIIEGLENMSNLVDAQRADLKSKCKIETLALLWHRDQQHGHPGKLDRKRLTLRLIKIQPGEERIVGEDMNNSVGLLECLQPHSQLKKLVLQGYPSARAPGWLGDPLSLQAIKEVRLQDCPKLHSLPFRNIHTLKHLRVYNCSGIQVLQLEQLPTQLKRLHILYCDKLELVTGYNIWRCWLHSIFLIALF